MKKKIDRFYEILKLKEEVVRDVEVGMYRCKLEDVTDSRVGENFNYS